MPSTPAASRPTEFLQRPSAATQALRDELALGLAQPQPAIAPKFLYDALGSKLFEAITELDEYYPTRTEALILEHHRDGLAQACGTGHTLVDLGAGNCTKAARLFDVLRPSRYVAVDISVDFLHRALHELQARYPQLPMLGVGLDFSAALELPPQAGNGRRLMFYPGSSIGNFSPDAAVGFLRRVREAAPDGGLLIGVDLVKPAALLQRAYDDALGVTAAFNLNLLRHVNRLLGSDFDVAQWQHVALFDAAHSRVEMHLQARCDLQVRWPGGHLTRRAGERVLTEHSCKYTVEGFDQLLRRAGYARTRCWTDPQRWFAVFVAH
ncbi:MAG TPA: L-histidine N(alpha)-methyltransferase [Rubrivivax sp.]|nr:L-histidine N(alpha)-methyltransferase [Rubrivivax sp.]